MLANIGAQARVAPSGHSLIKKAMKETGALLAGELSCHFFFHDRYFGYDDGIYAALRLLELLHLSGKSLQELLASIPQKVSSPEFRIACKNDTEKLLIVAAVKDIFCQRTDIELITIDGIRAHMSYGWGLLRASNTQPVISLRFESNDADGLARVKKDFYTLLQPYFDEHFLRNEIEL
jgi:phosphomannomutase/phosphoglucomutase